MNIRILILCTAMATTNLYGQQTEKPVSIEEMEQKAKELQQKIEEGKRRTDSILKAIDSSQKELIKEQNKENTKAYLEQNERSINAYLAEKSARDKKKSTRLWIRGGMLALALIIGIVSYLKKRKN